jgi:surface-anchored protein
MKLTMNFKKYSGSLVALTAAVFGISANTMAVEKWTVVSHGHHNIVVDYQNEEWEFLIDGTDAGNGMLNPDTTVLQLTDAAKLSVPANDKFSFLGSPGNQVWIAPMIENPALLLLGLSGYPIDFFQDEKIQIRLISVDGPGLFSVYEKDVFGTPIINMGTHDGLDENDVRELTVGDHYHLNWGFNRPGTYYLELQAIGVRASDQVELTSAVTTFSFEVVAPKPVDLTLTKVNPTTIKLNWQTEIEVSYQLQQKVSDTSNWEDMGDVVKGDGSEVYFDIELNPNSPAGWFRVMRIWI